MKMPANNRFEAKKISNDQMQMTFCVAEQIPARSGGLFKFVFMLNNLMIPVRD